MPQRTGQTHVIKFAAGQSVSQEVDLGTGCFGSFIVPPGSEAIGKAIQFVALPNTKAAPSDQFPATNLLTTPKVMASGNNALSTSEITEVGAASRARFSLSDPVIAATTIWLLWKN